MFLIIMVVGLVGLGTMAIPAFSRHGAVSPNPGHAAHGHGHGGHFPHASHGPAPATSHTLAAAKSRSSQEILPAEDVAPSRIVRLLPSPRGVFTALALYGAFGNALVDAFHLTSLFAALAAVIPAALVDRLAVRPLWKSVFRLRASPSAALGALIFNDAVAVVPFRNGRGVVSTTHDGRMIQLSARLRKEQEALTVRVGDRLRIEEVDPVHERVTVSVLRNE